MSGNGSVKNGDIITGASGGNAGASSTGASIGVSATIPAGLMILSSNDSIYGSGDSIHNGDNDSIYGFDRSIDNEDDKTSIGIGSVGVEYILLV